MSFIDYRHAQEQAPLELSQTFYYIRSEQQWSNYIKEPLSKFRELKSFHILEPCIGHGKEK